MWSFWVRAREAQRGEDVMREAAMQSSRPLSCSVNQATRRRDFTHLLTYYLLVYQFAEISPGL